MICNRRPDMYKLLFNLFLRRRERKEKKSYSTHLFAFKISCTYSRSPSLPSTKYKTIISIELFLICFRLLNHPYTHHSLQAEERLVGDHSMQLVRGTLITCDAPVKQIISALNDQFQGPQRFVIEDLDETHVFIKSDRLTWLREELEKELEKNTWRPEEVKIAITSREGA